MFVRVGVFAGVRARDVRSSIRAKALVPASIQEFALASVFKIKVYTRGLLRFAGENFSLSDLLCLDCVYTARGTAVLTLLMHTSPFVARLLFVTFEGINRHLSTNWVEYHFFPPFKIDT